MPDAIILAMVQAPAASQAAVLAAPDASSVSKASESAQAKDANFDQPSAQRPYAARVHH